MCSCLTKLTDTRVFGEAYIIQLRMKKLKF